MKFLFILLLLIFGAFSGPAYGLENVHSPASRLSDKDAQNLYQYVSQNIREIEFALMNQMNKDQISKVDLGDTIYPLLKDQIIFLLAIADTKKEFTNDCIKLSAKTQSLIITLREYLAKHNVTIAQLTKYDEACSESECDGYCDCEETDLEENQVAEGCKKEEYLNKIAVIKQRIAEIKDKNLSAKQILPIYIQIRNFDALFLSIDDVAFLKQFASSHDAMILEFELILQKNNLTDVDVLLQQIFH
jgi:hypothetical protein